MQILIRQTEKKEVDSEVGHTDFTSFAETAAWASALGNTQLEPSLILLCPKEQSQPPLYLIPRSTKPLREIQPKKSSHDDLLPLR